MQELVVVQSVRVQSLVSLQASRQSKERSEVQSADPSKGHEEEEVELTGDRCDAG